MKCDIPENFHENMKFGISIAIMEHETWTVAEIS